MELTFQKILSCIQESVNLEQLAVSFKYLRLFRLKYGENEEYQKLWLKFLEREIILKGFYTE
jgi:hypothetical protein